jgi:hypothetical protein
MQDGLNFYRGHSGVNGDALTIKDQKPDIKLQNLEEIQELD